MDEPKIPLFTWSEFKLPKTVYRKLGKEQAWAQLTPDGRKIEMDTRARGKKEMELHIHELIHFALPKMGEDDVRMLSRKLTEYLWREGYRKADHSEK